MVELDTAKHVVRSTVDRLRRHHPLGEQDQRAIERLGASPLAFAAGQSLSRRGARTDLLVIQSGWAIRTRDLPDGRRQIYSFLLAGDVVAFSGVSRGWSNTSVTALTAVKAIDLTGACELSDGSSLAMACDAAIEAERQFVLDHVARLGQQDAHQRLVDLLAELCGRMKAAGLLVSDVAILPITQDMLAEALGVTAVHVRRLMPRLKAADLVMPRRSVGLALNAGLLIRLASG